MSAYSDYKVSLENPNSSWTMLFNLVQPGSTVLDVGCSAGYFSKLLTEEKSCVVDGLELDESDAETARQNGCRSVVVGNVEELELKDSFDVGYDAIVFADVLEHLLDPASVLAKSADILNPGGKILFSIPNMANASIRLQLLQGNFDYEDEGLLDRTHLRFYTLQTINEMVNASGLELLELDATTFDVTEEITDKVLHRIGLAPTPEFHRFLSTGEALVYQYIGVLGVNRGADGVTPEEQVQSIKPRLCYEEQMKEVQEVARTNFARLKELEKEHAELLSELQNGKDLMAIYRVPGLERLVRSLLGAYRRLKP
jgi:2-polyprenyl-3-methyl-5-hydroxy-6-metoxy-1,4-benzoquinol methylase